MNEDIKIIGKAKINGVELNVCSQIDAEKTDLVICGFEEMGSIFNDDVHTECCFCKRPIIHRPHAPLSPDKCCILCMLELVEIEKENKGISSLDASRILVKKLEATKPLPSIEDELKRLKLK